MRAFALVALASCCVLPAHAADSGALFGIGWGIAGFCPGPALVALGAGEGKAVLFVSAMLVGMALFEWCEQGRRPGTGQEKDPPLAEATGS